MSAPNLGFAGRSHVVPFPTSPFSCISSLDQSVLFVSLSHAARACHWPRLVRPEARMSCVPLSGILAAVENDHLAPFL